MSVSSYTALAEAAAAAKVAATEREWAARRAEILTVAQGFISGNVIPSEVIGNLGIDLSKPDWNATGSVFFGGGVQHKRQWIAVRLRVSRTEAELEFDGRESVALRGVDDQTLPTRIGSAILAASAYQYQAQYGRAERAVGRVSEGTCDDDIEAAKDRLDGLEPEDRKTLRNVLAQRIAERTRPARRRHREAARKAAEAAAERAQLAILANEFAARWEAWDAACERLAAEQTARMFSQIPLWEVQYDTEDEEPLAAVVLALPDKDGRAVEVLANGRTRRVVFYRPIVAYERGQVEMSVAQPLPYYRSWQVGRYWVNVPPNSPDVPIPARPAPEWETFISEKMPWAHYAADLSWQGLRNDVTE